MYSVTFPYQVQKSRRMPIIPIILFGRTQSLAVEGYVDSGAFYSIFDMELAGKLGLEPALGKKLMLIVGDGSFIPTHIFRIPVKIGEKKFTSEIGFSDKLNIGFNLIGRKGIFENFDEVVFRENDQEIEFRCAKL